MNEARCDKLDDLMDRFVFVLLSRRQGRRVRRKIESDPEWQLAYEAAVERQRVLVAGVHAGGTPLGAGAALPVEVLAAGRKRELRAATRRRIVRGVFIGLIGTAAIIVLGMWLHVSELAPPPYHVRLIGQSEILSGSTVCLRAFVTHESGGPARNVRARFTIEPAYSDGPKPLHLECKSDADGNVADEVRIPDWPEGKYEVRGWVAQSKAAEPILNAPITIRRACKLYLATDKPIYQPGQTIRMRCLALRKPALKPYADAKAEFSVTDPAGNVIFIHAATLSEYGIGWADLPLDELVNPGLYDVKVAVGADESRQTVDIFHYKLPAFSVKVDLDRPWYLPGQTATGTVHVQYHFGKPVANATIVLDPTGRTTLAPGGGPRRPELPTLDVQHLTTDADGRAAFHIALPKAFFGFERTGGDAHLPLSARVSDSAGQEHTGYRTLVVARQDIRIVAAPENGTLGAGGDVAGRVYVVTSYPDGRPAKALLDIEGIAQGIRTDDAGAAVIAQQGIPARLAVSARDDAGRTGKVDITLPRAEGNSMVLRTDRPVYNAGQTIHVEVLAPQALEVFLDVVKDGQTMLTRAMKIADGRATLALDLGGELAGTLDLHAYRLNHEGDWVGRDVLVVVRPAGQLGVTVRKDKDEYRPGGEARLAFRVTDPSGKPTPAALSLSAVDEAVYSVQQAAPGFEQTILGLDAELLTPAIEAHGFQPALIDTSDDYARAVLASAAASRRPVMTRVRDLLQDAVSNLERGAPRTPDERRRMVERVQFLRDLRLREEVVEVGAEPHGKHTLDVEGDPRPANQRYEEAKHRAGPLTVLAVIASLSILWAWAVYEVVAHWKSHPYPRARVLFLDIFLLFAWPALLCAVLAVVFPAAAHRMAAGFAGTQSIAGEAVSDWAPSVSYMYIIPPDTGTPDFRREIHPRRALFWVPPATVRPRADAAARLRTYFPETLLWRPQVIAGPDGRAELTVPLADSITSWRLGGSAVSPDGLLGTVRADVRVFQPFFVEIDAPLVLTRGDEVSVPLAIYNYTAGEVKVKLQAEGSAGLAVLDVPAEPVPAAPGEPRRAYVRVRADAIGEGTLTVRASAGGVADAIRRTVRVEPPGLPRSLVVNGEFTADRHEAEVTIPLDAVPGSVSVQLKAYPGRFSELLDGLEGLFRMPYGCFEQTTSITYPNVMALSYMEANKLGSPAVRARARRYIHLGCQRLLSFEVDGGGFSWFGHRPAQTALTAYGLMEFADMAKVHNVDPAVLARTVQWLVRQQEASGVWRGDLGGPHGGGLRGDLELTAFATWGLAGHDGTADARRLGGKYVAANIHRARDAYSLALCANALLAAEGVEAQAKAAVERLASMAQADKDGRRYWPAGGETLMYGRGRYANVEATGLATLALSQDVRYRKLANDAARWLIDQRDGYGTWGTTQATVTALKALLAVSDSPQKRQQDAEITVTAPTDASGEAVLARIRIPPDESEAVHTAALPTLTAPGTYRLAIDSRNAVGMAWQVVVRYHSLQAAAPPAQPGLAVSVDYDRTDLATGGTVRVRAVVENNSDADARMVVVDLGTPPGFAVRPAGLDKLRDGGAIQRYTLTARGVIVYLDALAAGQRVTIGYDMSARMPLRAAAAPTVVYAYYDPDRRASAAPATFVVR